MMYSTRVLISIAFLYSALVSHFLSAYRNQPAYLIMYMLISTKVAR